MEEKLFWISLVSGGFALGLKRFMARPGRLDRTGPVAAMNASFWAFVGLAAGFLLVSYKELTTLTPVVGAVCLVAGGTLGLLWAWPRRMGSPALSSVLWALQAAACVVSVGRILGVDSTTLTLWAGIFAVVGGGAGALVHTGSSVAARGAVGALLSAEGARIGVWMGSSPAGISWATVAVLAGLGYVLGSGWRPSLIPGRDSHTAVLRETLEWADTGFSAILLAAAIMFFAVQAFKIPSGSMRLTLMEGDHLFVNKFRYGWRIPYTDKRILRWREVQRGDIVVFKFPATDKNSSHYGKDFIKRAIGLPGDTVEIRNKRVFVNGEPWAESYTNFADDNTYPRPWEPSFGLAAGLPVKDGDRSRVSVREGTVFLDGKSLEGGSLGYDDLFLVLRDTAAFQVFWEKRWLSPMEDFRFRDNFGPVRVPAGSYFVMGDNRDRSFDSRFWGPMPDGNLKGRAWILYWPLSRRKWIR